MRGGLLERSGTAAVVSTLAASLLAVSPDADPQASTSAQTRARRLPHTAGQTLNVCGTGVLANDQGHPGTVVSHTPPAHGSLTVLTARPATPRRPAPTRSPTPRPTRSSSTPRTFRRWALPRGQGRPADRAGRQSKT